jgi:hypothetical protein
MIFAGRVLDAKGVPLERAEVEMVAPKGREIGRVGAGKVGQGALSLEADPGPVWGLRIDGRPVVATVASSDGSSADLGEIILFADGFAWPVFHALDGRVFGLPRVARIEAALKADAPPGQPREPVEPPAVPAGEPTTGRPVATRGGLTFGALLGSTARQLSTVVTSTKGLQLAGANITIKGVPTATDDAIGLEFPNAELAAAGTGLSELSFTLKPRGDIEPPPAPDTPSGQAVPDLLGYTRDLAVRKLATLRLASEVREEITADSTRVGRVVRQFPRPGEAVSASTLVRIFIGKQGAA